MTKVANPALATLSNSLLTAQGQGANHKQMESTAPMATLPPDECSFPDRGRGTLATETQALLSDLARVKALFQLRAIAAVIGGGE